MKPFIEQAQFYAEYHQNPMTRYTHLIGVPLIILSLMILLGFVKIILPGVFTANLAGVAAIVALYYYFRLNWQLSLALIPIFSILLWIAHWFNHAGPTKLGFWAFLITFILGWGLQLYGHYIEVKKPALMDNFYQAMIAPLFLAAELFFIAGLMLPLKEQIYGQQNKANEKK